MLLGKRPRLPIKRTASMSGIRLDLGDVELEEPSDHDDLPYVSQNSTMLPHNYSALVSPRLLRNQSPDHFLRTCGLCKRRLSPGRDIYMYRGDTAFCSSECREKQIKQDERKEEYSTVGSKNKDNHRAASTSTKGSRKTQTVAAA